MDAWQSKALVFEDDTFKNETRFLAGLIFCVFGQFNFIMLFFELPDTLIH